MNWEQLLSMKRIGKKDGEDATVGRSNFQRDFDRIVFSSAFRRLQDKTQVFPLAKSDFVRTRLTHSLEVSCIGRSLGTEVGIELEKKRPLPKGFLPADIGAIVAAGCIAHDIGNPPFGMQAKMQYDSGSQEMRMSLKSCRQDKNMTSAYSRAMLKGSEF